MATNISSIGTGQDYTTITAWESAVQGDLVTAGNIEVGECINETFDERVTIDGSTTDASNYLILRAASGAEHDGTSHSGARIEPSSGSGHILTVSDNFVRIETLEFDLTNDTTSSDECIRNNATNTLYRKLLLYTEDATPTTQQDGIYLPPNLAQTITIENCIFYGFARCGIHAQNHTGSAALIANVRNCFLYNCGHDTEAANSAPGGIGAHQNTSTGNTTTINCDNTIALENTSGSGAEDFNVYVTVDVSWNGDRNISSDGTATGRFGAGTGVGNRDTRTLTTNASPGAGDWVIVTSTTATSEDFHLQSSAENDAEGAGLDLSGNFTDDIDGDTRSDWDIGPDEIVAAAASFLWSQRASQRALLRR